MNELPCLEEIYDFETEQLTKILSEIKSCLELLSTQSPPSFALPENIDSYEKFERKALKLKEHIELELDERQQVDDVINFFSNGTSQNKNDEIEDLLNDNQFYQPKQSESQQNVETESQSVFGNGYQEMQSDRISQSNDLGEESQTSSSVSKQLFMTKQNALKNKKDLQQFMKEKLAKTKISSATTSQVASTGPMQKNFKKPQASVEEESYKSTKPSSTQSKPSIYKPNIKKPTSSFKSGRDNSQERQQTQFPPKKKVDSSKEKEEKKVQRKTSSGLREVKPVVKENKRASHMSKKSYSKPPIMPKKDTDKPGCEEEHKEEKDYIQGWERGVVHSTTSNWESRKELDLMDGKEEIESKYSDGENIQEEGKEDDIETKLVYVVDNNGCGKEEVKGKQKKKDKVQVLEIEECKKMKAEEELLLRVSKPQIKANTDEKEKKEETLVEEEDGSDGDGNEEVYEDDFIGIEGYSQQVCFKDEDFYAPLGQPEREEAQQNLKSNSRKLSQETNSLPIQRDNNDQQSDLELNEEPNSTPTFNNQEKEEGFLPNSLPEQEMNENYKCKVEIKGKHHQKKEEERGIEEQEWEEGEGEAEEQEKEKEKEAKEEMEKDGMKPNWRKSQKAEGQKFEDEKLVRARQKLEEYRYKQEQRKKELELEEEQKRVQKEKETEEQKEKVKQIKEQLEIEKKTKGATQSSSQDNDHQSQENSSQKLQEKDQNLEEKKQDSEKKQKKPAKPKPKPVPLPRQIDADQVVDYSGHYKSFYDIFVGQILEPKTFDLTYAVRDARNMYAAFVNIMDSNALQMRKKHQFEQAPFEKSLQDYYSLIPNAFSLVGKNINDLDLEMKNRGNEIIQQAMTQAQLRDNYQQIKNKTENDLVKEAQEKTGIEGNQAPSLIDQDRDSTLYFRVVKSRSEVYDIITRSFSRKKKWTEMPHGLDLRNSWNFLWTWSKIKIDISKLLVWQKCNHYNGAKNVSRKDFLKRNLERAQKMSSRANSVFNILPLTFILPKEYVGFLESFSEFEDQEGKLNYWIMKPAAKSRGRGISLVNDLTQVSYGEPIVVQRYIKNPLLINGYKFDMRIYVIVTSVNPLEAFLYREGFGRFSTTPFSIDPTDKNNKYIHLTNVSIQKYNINNYENDSSDVIYGGTKISLQTLKKRVEEEAKINWDQQIWTQVREVIIKSLAACQNDIQFNPCCFELFGYDILIDSDMKCWLIEINSSPSLARETLLDDMVKQRMIDDTIELIDPIDFDRRRLFEVLERRINEDFKQNSSSSNFAKKQMNRDLTYILNGKVPRKYGEMPRQMGNFERIAPSPQLDQYLKLLGGQKMFGSTMKIQQTQQ